MKGFSAEIHFYRTEDGGRHLALRGGTYAYRPLFAFGGVNYHCQIEIAAGVDAAPGDSIRARIALPDFCPAKTGDRFFLREGKLVADGKIISDENREECCNLDSESFEGIVTRIRDS